MTPVLVRIAFSSTKGHSSRTGYQQYEHYSQRDASNAHVAKSSASFPHFFYTVFWRWPTGKCAACYFAYILTPGMTFLLQNGHISRCGANSLIAVITTVHCRIMTVSHLMETRWRRGYILTEARMKSYNAWYSPFTGSALEVI